MFATLETLLRKTFSVYQTVTHFPSLANDPLFRITVPGKRNFEKEKPDRQTEYNSRREERIFQATRESGQLSENLSSNVNFERMVPKLRYEPGERREIFSLRDFISFFFFFSFFSLSSKLRSRELPSFLRDSLLAKWFWKTTAVRFIQRISKSRANTSLWGSWSVCTFKNKTVRGRRIPNSLRAFFELVSD